MNTLKTSIIQKALFLIMCFALNSALAQTFQSTNGPEGGVASELAIDSQGTLFAGTRSGMYRSTDNGETWHKADEGFRSNYTSSIVINDSDHIFAGTSNLGVYRSTDGGESWENFSSGLSASNVQSLKITPAGELVAGVDRGGVFRSTDNGETWTSFNNGLINDRVFSVAMANNGDLYYGTINDGVYRFAATDTVWRSIAGGRSNRRCNWLEPYGEDGMLAGTGSNVDYLTAGDTTWMQFAPNTSGTGFVTSILVDTEQRVFISTLSGCQVYDTTSGAFLKIQNGITHNRTNKIIADANNNLFLASDAGVYRSTDLGATWDYKPSGFITARITCVVSYPDGTLLIGDESNGVYRSTDGGETWQQVNEGLSSLSVRSMMLDASGVVYAGVSGSKGVYRSENKGDTWTNVRNGLDTGAIYMIASRDSMLYVAPTNKTVHFSSNGGDNWQELPVNGFSNKSFRSILPLPDGNLLAGTWGGGIYHLVAGDTVWTERNQGLPSLRIPAIIMMQEGELFAGVYGAGIYRSADNGQTWQETTSQPTSSTINTIKSTDAGEIIVSTTNGLFYTYDKGETWFPLSDGLVNSNVNGFTITADREIFVGTAGDGVYKASLLPTSAETAFEKLPSESSLNQNYPNPFNPTTTIQFELAKQSKISLHIFDIRGRLVRSMASGQFSAGLHQVRWHGRDNSGHRVASGVYIYQLKSNEFTQTRRMLLLQ